MSVKQKKRWDARALIGVALVGGSVVATVTLVNNLDRTIPVYVAAHNLTPGTVLQASDLAVVRVRLDTTATQYISGNDTLRDAVVTRTVSAGEMLPAASVGSVDDVTTTAMTVALSQALPASLTVGRRVELWTAGELDPLVTEAIITAIPREQGLMAAPANNEVEVRVSRADVPVILAAQSAELPLSLVGAAL